MKLSDQNEPTTETTPGSDRAMDGLLHEFASHKTTDDVAFLTALETALDNVDGAPIAEPVAIQKSGQRWWKWGLAGSAAACVVGMLVWRERKPTVTLATASLPAANPGLAENEIIKRGSRIEAARKVETEGDQLMAEGNYEAALNKFQSAFSSIPEAPFSAVDRARMVTKFSNASIKQADNFGKMGRFAEAKNRLNQVLVADVDQDNASAKTLLKRLDDPDYYNPSMSSSAYAQTEEVIKLQKEGMGYFDLGQYAEAENSFNSILAIDPHNVVAREQLEKTEHEVDSYLLSARDHTKAMMLRNVDEMWESGAPQTVTGSGFVPGPSSSPGLGVGFVAATPTTMSGTLLAGTTSASVSSFSTASNGGGEGELRGKGKGGQLGNAFGPGVGGGGGLVAQDGGTWKSRYRMTDGVDSNGSWRYQPVTDFADLPGSGDRSSNGDKYNAAIENPFLSPLKAPLSTFSVDVDTASYANLRRMIQEGQTVPPAAVRIEEMVNYFTYNYPQPEGAHPFSVNVETASCPWAPTHRLVKIGLKAKEIAKEKRPSANLVFLCDVSGSMNSPDKLPLLVENLKVLTNELNADDTVSIVVYAGNEGVALPPTSGGDKETILKALNNLSSGGSTNGGAGIARAYKMAQERFVKGGINRVVLCTDGDFNVGTTSNDALVNLVKEKAAGGVFLTVCGYGRGNLNDAMLESITDKGNGVYHYVDSEKEGKKIFKDELFGTLMTVAKDVKLQVEFNPDKVGSYRLVGYDNRMLRKEDFANDKVDAGDIGSGHCVTALYEVVPPGVDEPQKPADDLKYQKGIMPTSTNQEPHFVKHADGSSTKSVLDAEKNRIVEDKFDANQVLVRRKIFQMDDKGRVRNGVVMDAKGDAIGSLKYGYKEDGTINEERLYNTKGELVQRKFPPGTLVGVAANVNSPVVFNVDSTDPAKLVDLAMTVLDPTEESFTPGLPVVPPQKPQAAEPKAVASHEMLTVKLRYKEPDATESKLFEVPHTDAGQTLATASSDFKFASAVAEFGERLRGKRPEGRNAGMILEQAESARGHDPHGLRGEFIELVKKVSAQP